MDFDRQPTLIGALVELRPLRPEDLDPLWRIAADREMWAQHPDQTRHTEDGFRRFFAGALDSGGALTAIDAATGQVIGTSRYHGFDPAASEVEIGWTFLARSHWGGRYNGEMKALMLRHAFRFVENVVFIIGPLNLRSQRAVAKIGAVPAGTRIGSEGDANLVFRITARSFEAHLRRA